MRLSKLLGVFVGLSDELSFKIGGQLTYRVSLLGPCISVPKLNIFEKFSFGGMDIAAFEVLMVELKLCSLFMLIEPELCG